MRTTIHLDDALYRDVKTAAAKSGQTVTALIQEALRERLARRKGSTRQKRSRLPAGKGKALRDVDQNDFAALLEWMQRDFEKM